jgi:hypothetical protein
MVVSLKRPGTGITNTGTVQARVLKAMRIWFDLSCLKTMRSGTAIRFVDFGYGFQSKLVFFRE